MRRHAALFAALFSVALVARTASADPLGQVVTLKPIEIRGRARLPVAAIEVQKAVLRLPLAELRDDVRGRLDATADSGSL